MTGGWQAAALNGATFAGTEDSEDKPALMGNLRADQAWGSAMIGAGIRDVHSRITDGTGANFTEKTGHAFGWLVNGGISLKLPVVLPGFGFATGDKLVVRGGYSEGFDRFVYQNGGNDAGVADAVWNGVCPTGVTSVACFKLETVQVWTATVGLTHYWTPELRSNASYSYAASSTPLGPFSAFGAGGDWDAHQAMLNLLWSPVKNLDIGIEGIYARAHVERGALGQFAASLVSTSCAGVAGFTEACSKDPFGGIFRVQRSF